MYITSRSNSQIKQIRKLTQAKERKATGTFFIAGPHLVLEALQAGGEVVELIFCSDLMDSLEPAIKADLLRAAEQHSTLYLSKDVFSTLSDRRDQHFGCAAVLRQRWLDSDQVEPDSDSLWLAAHAIQYPANLGTMMRTLDGAGGSGLIVLGDGTDPYDPVAIRASQGSVFRHRILRMDTTQLAEWLQRNPMHVVGTSPGAKKMYRDITYRRPCLVLMGNERHGLGPDEMALCEDLVTIPMLGECDSHNVAVATALVLYEAHFRSSIT